jgi:hypothetical protein
MMGTGDDGTAVKLVFDNEPVERYDIYEELEDALAEVIYTYAGRLSLVSALGVLRTLEHRLFTEAES